VNNKNIRLEVNGKNCRELRRYSQFVYCGKYGKSAQFSTLQSRGTRFHNNSIVMFNFGCVD
jgi:hypothetical protein